MSRRLIAIVSAWCIALSLVAATGAADWQRHTVRSAGFALDAPSTWVDLTSSAPGALDELVKQDPSLASLLKEVKANQLIKLLCSEPSGRANVNVVAVTVGSSSLQAFVQANVAQIKASSLVRGAVVVSSTTLPAGAAAVVRYEEVVGTSPRVSTTQYYLTHAGKGYVITFTTRPSMRAAYGATFRESIGSFRFVGSGTVS